MSAEDLDAIDGCTLRLLDTDWLVANLGNAATPLLDIRSAPIDHTAHFNLEIENTEDARVQWLAQQASASEASKASATAAAVAKGEHHRHGQELFDRLVGLAARLPDSSVNKSDYFAADEWDIDGLKSDIYGVREDIAEAAANAARSAVDAE